MLPSNGEWGSPTRRGPNIEGRPNSAKHSRLASRSPETPQITSDVHQGSNRSLAAATSYLPLHGTPPRNKHILSPSRKPPQPSASTPGRSRLEVVIKASPQTAQRDQKLWSDARQDEQQERASATSNQIRKQTHKPESQVATPVTQPHGKRSRGRPKGWRPGMPSTKTGQPTASAHKYVDGSLGTRISRRAPPAVPISSAPGIGQKRRGRPPRPPSPTPRDVWETLAAPKYVPFLCEWAGCKAELQNVETLRRHVRKIHGLAGPLVCQWGSCGRKIEEGQSLVAFSQDTEFHKHMDERHLQSFVWHVGEGPRNGTCIMVPSTEAYGSQVPAYLLGPHGEQVTPWVKEQKLETFQTWRENRRRLKDILSQRDANAPLEEEEAADDASQPDEINA